MTTTSIRGRAVSHRGLLAVMCACVGMVAASSLRPQGCPAHRRTGIGGVIGNHRMKE
jgi:hypothetical protein